MTRENIIRMAREAGLCVGTNLSGVVLVGAPAEIGLAHLTIEELERFAALVSAAARAEENEACAKACEEAHWSLDDRHEYAALIRARGQA